MTNYIEIGGEKRPVRFGFAGLYEYEMQTGRKALADFAKLSDGIENVSITLLVDLIYYGLTCGYRKEKKNVDFDKRDVADWIGQDQGVLEVAMQAFADSFPKGNGMAETAKAIPSPKS